MHISSIEVYNIFEFWTVLYTIPKVLRYKISYIERIKHQETLIDPSEDLSKNDRQNFV